jgi:hypothetical protein
MLVRTWTSVSFSKAGPLNTEQEFDWRRWLLVLFVAVTFRASCVWALSLAAELCLPVFAEHDVRNYRPAYPAVRNLTVCSSTALLNCSTSRLYWSVQKHIPVQVFNSSYLSNSTCLFTCSKSRLFSTVQQHISFELFNSTSLFSITSVDLFNVACLLNCSTAHFFWTV